MLKALALRLNQCFGPFTMLHVEGSSPTGAFRHLSKPVFRCREFRKYRRYVVRFFKKCWKFTVDSKNEEKNWEKMFCFWDKCIWIVCIELSLLRREYLSSAVNLLTESLKTFHVTKKNFSNSLTFRVINQYGKGAGIKIESVFRPVYHAAFRGVLSNGSF